jgi:hypothetical protein
MAAPELASLRALMGDEWVEANILAEKAQHPLGLWYHKGDENPWVFYTEQLVAQLLKGDAVTLDKGALAHKLAADYIPTLAEMEVAAHLMEQGCALVLEPTAPAKGPDMRADYGDRCYFVEVRAVGDSEDDDRFNAVSSEIFARLNETPSRYTVKVTVGDECVAGSGDLKKAIDAIIASRKDSKCHRKRPSGESGDYCRV